jgi:hypothetical protein
MAAAQRIFLVFEGVWLEVDASLVQRRGCLRTFAREAESKWDLQPSSYEIHHSSGKVDSIPALQNALKEACDDVCKLEIVEGLEGKMLRTMRKEMKLLEDRVMAKVETALTNMSEDTQWNKTRLAGGIAPIVQCLAAEQIEMREKLGQLCATGVPSPLVQCIATEQIEMREKVDQLCAEVSDMTSVQKASAASMKDDETLEQELQQECATQAACDLDLASGDGLEELRAEVSQMGQKAGRTQPATIAPPDSTDFKHTFGESDTRLQWSTSIAYPASIPYSAKLGKGPLAPATGFEARWHAGDKFSYVKLGDQGAAPFAQSTMYSKSTFGHRSCPVLPPLH